MENQFFKLEDKEEELEVMQSSIKHMRYQYLWPKKDSTNFFIKSGIAFFLTFPLILGILLHFIAATAGLDRLSDDASEDIAIIVALMGFCIMLTSFLRNQTRISTLWRSLGTSGKFGRPDDFEKRRQRLDIISRGFSYYSYVALVVYFFLRMHRKRECDELNAAYNLNEICGMIVPIWAPFNVNVSPYREIVWFFQGYGAYFFCKGTTAVATTTLEVGEYIVLKIKHLRRLLREVFDDPREEERRKKLIFCIEYHQHIISLQKSFEKCYRGCNSVYVLVVGVIFAGVANEFMKEQSVGPMLHLFGWVLSFYLCCHAGQSVLTESLKISISAFESRWYYASVSLRKDLLTLIVNSQRPLYLHAAPLGIMDLELFKKVVKTSYSYFTLLNQTT